MKTVKIHEKIRLWGINSTQCSFTKIHNEQNSEIDIDNPSIFLYKYETEENSVY